MRSFLFLQPLLTERAELFWLIPTKSVHKLNQGAFKNCLNTTIPPLQIFGKY